MSAGFAVGLVAGFVVAVFAVLLVRDSTYRGPR